MKKGMNDLTLVWIFATVAGAIILAFFFRFGESQEGIFDARNAREAVFSLNDQLTAFGTSEESSKIIPMNFENGFSFACNAISTEDFSLDTNKILFAPEKISDDVLISIREWEFPYPIAKFYYLSGKNSRTLVVYDANSYDYVMKLEIPEIFNAQKQSITSFNAEKLQQESSTLDSLAIIFFTKAPKESVFSKIKLQNLNVVEVDLNKKQLTIANRKETFTDFYLGEEMMIGSFFAPADYRCIKDAAMEKLRILTGVYEGKAMLLQSKTTDQSCESKLHEIQSAMNSFKTSTINNVLQDYAEKINEQNKNLRKNDCNEIY